MARHSGLARDILRFVRDHSDRPASDSAFEDLALRLFRHQFEHNAVYRAICLSRGTHPERVRSWKRVPALPTTAFKRSRASSFRVRARGASSARAARRAKAEAPMLSRRSI